MKILVSDPAPLGDLVAYLTRCGCTVQIVGRVAIEVEPPARPPVDQAYRRMELDAYLRVWREMHPDVSAELVEPSAA